VVGESSENCWLDDDVESTLSSVSESESGLLTTSSSKEDMAGKLHSKRRLLGFPKLGIVSGGYNWECVG